MTLAFEKTFDSAAEEYDKIRPSYLPAIYEDILQYQPLNADSNTLEIGIGSGIATRPILNTGCKVVGLEPGEHLAALAKNRFREYALFSVETCSLQEFVCPADCFDLIYAATAFHWIPEEYGYRRVYELLKEGGTFARFHYHAGSDKGREKLTDEIQALYREYLKRGKPAEFGKTDAEAIAAIALNYGFVDPEYRIYRTTKDFTADEYLSLLHTYPDHMKLEESNRHALFNGIHQAILRNGCVITVYYTMDLELARKPFR